ncbi:hypothetical protein B4099_2719 [Heyndrickxia coagulans]|uniref:Uncharacterized protein n=1 Tax=Heyndrickxia coagulans TaxID=1398 RepID=A0A150KJ58_HEYCO|nr:hypothetical protein B4099_2719 [Heyndrickxia coagulans]
MGKKDFLPFCRIIRTRGSGKSKGVCGPKNRQEPHARRLEIPCAGPKNAV